MVSGTRYQVIRKIAEGGSAEVYLAEQRGVAGFRRPVVLKRIRAELSADAHYREILLEEAQLAMSLHHSNLVGVLDLGEAGGRYFLVLELVDGWTLHEVLRRAREAGLPLPPALAVYIAAEVCRGLAYAHQRTEGGRPLGIVHRDVCPNNVLLSTHAEVKLIDFGIAKARTRPTHTGTGRTKGKPAWMSPEQARAEPLDARSDLFSVGSVLFAMLTDVPPFSATSDLEVILRVSKGEVTSPALSRPDLPRQLRALVLKAMAKDRDDRFDSAQEMLLALEELQRGARQPAGRSELENYLRALSAKDGDTAITRQVLPPALPIDPSGSISLSQESAGVTRTVAPRSGWRGAVTALVLLAAAGGWLQQRPDAAALSSGGAELAEGPLEGRPDPAPLEAVSTVVAPSDGWPEWEEFLLPLPVWEPLRVSARLAPKQKSRAMVAVLLESHPAGVVIKVDQRELGRTPATLRLKSGRTYELRFEAEGNAPVRQRLMLTPRVGQLPKVTLRDPPP